LLLPCCTAASAFAWLLNTQRGEDRPRLDEAQLQKVVLSQDHPMPNTETAPANDRNPKHLSASTSMASLSLLFILTLIQNFK
jgi:hypothetical protein